MKDKKSFNQIKKRITNLLTLFIIADGTHNSYIIKAFMLCKLFDKTIRTKHRNCFTVCRIKTNKAITFTVFLTYKLFYIEKITNCIDFHFFDTPLK